MKRRLLVVALVALAAFGAAWKLFAEPPPPVAATPPPAARAAPPAEAAPPGLARELAALADDGLADYAACVWAPDWTEPLLLGNASRKAASVIKLYIMGEIYERAARGELDLSRRLAVRRRDMVGGSGVISGYPGEPEFSLRELVGLMIAESDNTATNVLIDFVGMDAVNGFIARRGFRETALRRKMMDFDSGLENLTSAADTGRFLHELLRHRLVSESADAEMIEILLRQTDRECLPAALSDARIAHKTGELVRLYHDAGIVYHNGSGYVLCLFSYDSGSRAGSLRTMRRMAKAVDAAMAAGSQNNFTEGRER